MSADALSLRDVHLAFEPGRPVLAGFSAEVPLTGCTVVAGPSGAGKSVVCRLAVGLLRPQAGEVELLGRPVHALAERHLRALRREAPYLVQGPALLDWRTVRENVQLADRAAPAAEVDAALARVGLTAAAERLPPELGPAARKRAAIARALLLRPRVLLLDEPTTGLDGRSAASVEAALGDLKAQGVATVVVSHDYGLLPRVADRVVVRAGGRCAFLGSPADFLASSRPELRALTAPYLEAASDG